MIFCGQADVPGSKVRKNFLRHPVPSSKVMLSSDFLCLDMVDNDSLGAKNELLWHFLHPWSWVNQVNSLGSLDKFWFLLCFPIRSAQLPGFPRVGPFFWDTLYNCWLIEIRCLCDKQLSKDEVTLFTLQVIPDNGWLQTISCSSKAAGFCLLCALYINNSIYCNLHMFKAFG